MSDAQFENEFANLVAADSGSPAVAEVTTAGPQTIAPKAPRVTLSPTPNPWGIFIKRTGEIVTMQYLRKWAQCSSRGEAYQYRRAENMDFFMTADFCAQFTGKQVGEFCEAVRTFDGWKDPAHPELDSHIERAPKQPKQPKAVKEPKAPKTPKAGKAPKTPVNAEQAAADELELLKLMGEQPAVE